MWSRENLDNQVVESYEAFLKLEPLWNEIMGKGGGQTPFQSFAWIDQWLRHRGNGIEPFVLVTQDGSTIAPFGINRVAGIRVLILLGTGDSDYPGLVTSSTADDAWDAVAEALGQHRSSWDLLHLHSVRSNEAIIAALARHIRTSYHFRPYDTCPWIATDCSWNDLLGSRRSSFRNNLKRWGRRMETFGEISVEVADSPVPEKIITDIEAIERASWKWELGDATLRTGPQRNFLEAVLKDPRMKFQLWLLRTSTQPIAFALVLVAQERWYYYQSVFRQDYPYAGSYLLARIIETACASKCMCVDLLRGPKTYKYAWTNFENTVYEIVCPSNIRGRVAAVAYAVRWRFAKSSILQGLRNRLMKTGDRR